MNLHGIQGEASSYWIASSRQASYPELENDLTVDVAIIGGGFAGIISALFLKEAGLKVAILEGDRILKGVTGNTTAKITSLHRLVYHDLIKRFGREKAGQFAESNQAAIEKIDSLVKERKIDCGFSRLPFYTYATGEEALRRIEDEVKAAQELGLPASFTGEIPLPVRVRGAVYFENQAQFHPCKFLVELASSIAGDGSHIFEKSRARHIEYGKACNVITDSASIKAEKVIIATNFPVFDKQGMYFARLKPSRSYAVACDIKDPFPRGMFIDAEKEGYAWRGENDNTQDLVIVSGSSHPAGHGGDHRENYRELERAANAAYAEALVKYSWSSQDNIPFDGAPYIGKATPFHNNVFVATGFSKWGMTLSVVAGMILTDLIQGKKNSWIDIYNPLRFIPDGSSAKKLVSENVHVVKMFVKDHISGVPDISVLKEGDAQVVEDKGTKVAAFKDEQGNIYRLSPNCTHLGCVLSWNNAERTWDCPCHGSRFKYSGEVIHGPAVKALRNIAEKE